MTEKSEKVTKYEKFVNDQLKEDCRKLYEREGALLLEKAEFELLHSHLERIQKDKLSSLHVSVDLGSSCFCDAHVPETSKVFVEAGLGFYVELSIEEALSFSKERVSGIDAQVAKVDEQISHVKAQIKLVTEGVRELMKI